MPLPIVTINLEKTIMQGKRIILLIAIASSLLFVTHLQCQADEILCGCMKNKQGTLRIIDCTEHCQKTESPVMLKAGSYRDHNLLEYFEGNLCWTMYLSDTSECPAIAAPYFMKLEVTHVKNTHYMLQGKIITKEGYISVSGSAFIQENSLFLTLATSHHQTPTLEFRDTGIFEIRLDMITLNGTWWGSYHSFDTVTREFDNKYSAGTLEFSTCPVMSLTY